MEPPGSEYAVLLHDPKLRDALIEHKGDSVSEPTISVRFRLHVAQVLRELARHIEPLTTESIPKTGLRAFTAPARYEHATTRRVGDRCAGP